MEEVVMQGLDDVAQWWCKRNYAQLSAGGKSRVRAFWLKRPKWEAENWGTLWAKHQLYNAGVGRWSGSWNDNVGKPL